MRNDKSAAYDNQLLTDDLFDTVVADLIAAKFDYTPDIQLERKPKADKGV